MLVFIQLFTFFKCALSLLNFCMFIVHATGYSGYGWFVVCRHDPPKGRWDSYVGDTVSNFAACLISLTHISAPKRLEVAVNKVFFPIVNETSY